VAPQLLRTRAKAAAGARFFQTQPLFLPEQWLAFREQLGEVGVETPILVGTFLLESPGMARYMHFKVPGVVIPEEVRSRIEEATDPKAYARDLVKDFIVAVRETGAPGVHLMTHNQYEVVAELAQELELSAVC
jgi:5,10-methylenetetrahydrofolate reductase